jgi:pimeloyl-ACP methyl ester carboxylesterase
MPYFAHDGIQFHYRDAGSGIPFVFQHGLGGDVGQPWELFRPPGGFRLLSFDFRGHGDTRPLGDPEKIHLGNFAEDMAEFLNRMNIEQAIVGGISMGAAVALLFALQYRPRVLGLVLSRPAWLDGPNPRNDAIFSNMVQLIRQHDARQGQQLFQQSADYQEILREAPESAASLLAQFDHPRAEETVVKLEQIPHDSPCRDLHELSNIAVPTLVLANRQDTVHPYAYGEMLARGIQHAEFAKLTPKSVSLERHATDTQRLIGDFLQRNFR